MGQEVVIEWNEAKQRFVIISTDGRWSFVMPAITSIHAVDLGPGTENELPLGEPYQQLIFYSWDMGKVFVTAPQCDLGRYTGLWGAPQQLGLGPCNATGVQVAGDAIGIYISPESHPERTSVIQPIVLNYNWRPWTGVKPWEREGKSLGISADLQVPLSQTEGGAVTYATLVLRFRNTDTGHNVWMVFQVQDARGFPDEGGYQPYEQVGWDKDPVHNRSDLPIIATAFHPSTQFASIAADSHRSTGATWASWRRFSATVSANQIQAALEVLKAAYPDRLKAMSTDPARWEIVGWNINPEVYYTADGGRSSIGMSVRHFTLSVQ
jgi:hypothetical protein